MAHGRYSYIAIGKESIHGQEATASNFLKFSGGGFGLEKENIESKALTGRLVKSDTAIGTRFWSGKINGVELDSTGQGLIFKSFFGSETVQGSNAPYTHTFKLSTDPDAYTSLTIEQYKTEWLRKFTGGRVNKLIFKGELNAIMTCDIEIVATNSVEKNPISDKQTPTFSNNVAFRFYETTLKVNNTAIPIKSFEVNLEEATEVDFNFLGGKLPTGILRGGVSGSVKFELNLSEISLDFWEDYLNEADKSIEIEMSKNANEKLQIVLPRVRFSAYEENDGDEILKSTLTGEVLSATTSDADSIQLILTNSRETEY